MANFKIVTDAHRFRTDSVEDAADIILDQRRALKSIVFTGWNECASNSIMNHLYNSINDRDREDIIRNLNRGYEWVKKEWAM